MRRIISGMAAAVLAATGVIATQTAAHAATCPPGVMCMWDFGANSSPIYLLFSEDSTFHNNAYPTGGSWGDKFSSYQNLSGVNYCFFIDVNFQPASRPYVVPASRRTPGTFPSAYNNAISSARPC